MPVNQDKYSQLGGWHDVPPVNNAFMGSAHGSNSNTPLCDGKSIKFSRAHSEHDVRQIGPGSNHSRSHAYEEGGFTQQGDWSPVLGQQG